MREKMEEGIDLLLALGTLISDEGQENDGNILIQSIDYKKFCLIETVLDYMGVEKGKLPYEFLYDDAYYLQENDLLRESDFNKYVVGIIIKKKQIEKEKK